MIPQLCGYTLPIYESSDVISGRDLAWEFVKSNYPLFKKRYESGSLFQRLVSFTTSSFTTEEKAEEIKEFFTKNFNPAERTVKQNIENTLLNAAWVKRDEQNLQKYFTQK